MSFHTAHRLAQKAAAKRAAAKKAEPVKKAAKKD